MSEDLLPTPVPAHSSEDAPSCGLYIVLQDTDNHNTQNFKLGQALHAANRFSNYSLNRHIVVFRPSQTTPSTLPATTNDVLAYQETCQRNGFIFLIEDDAELARNVAADGVICSSVQKATQARKIMSEDAIIGLRCATLALAKSAITHELDFISILSAKDGDSPLDILNWWTTATDNPVAIEGTFDQENCQEFVRGEATFIDASHHIWTHPSGNVMQGVVNMLDAFECYKPIIRAVN